MIAMRPWKKELQCIGNLVKHNGLFVHTDLSYLVQIRTFSDDGVSEWVNVLVPGYGRCQVKRSDLNFDGDGSTDTMGVGITSLSIRLNPNCEIAGDLSQFMAAVGGSLTSLSLHGSQEILGDNL